MTTSPSFLPDPRADVGLRCDGHLRDRHHEERGPAHRLRGPPGHSTRHSEYPSLLPRPPFSIELFLGRPLLLYPISSHFSFTASGSLIIRSSVACLSPSFVELCLSFFPHIDRIYGSHDFCYRYASFYWIILNFDLTKSGICSEFQLECSPTRWTAF